MALPGHPALQTDAGVLSCLRSKGWASIPVASVDVLDLDKAALQHPAPIHSARSQGYFISMADFVLRFRTVN